MATCPKCGSTNVKFEIRSAGTKSSTNYYRTGVKSSWFIPAGRKSYNSNRKQKSVGICQNCGHIWEPVEDGCLFYLICVLFFPITLSILFYKSNRIKMEKKYRVLVIIAAFLLIISLGAIIGSNSSNTNNANAPENNSVWAQEISPLSDFEFYINNNEIYLKKYKGRSKKVRIASSYAYDGVTMPVVSLDATFTLKSVDSVVIPNGVKKLSDHTFNSCGIKYLYLPNTVEEFDGWNYFHDTEKLYYGGTEEEFNIICNDERSQIDIVQIIFDTSIIDIVSIDANQE